MDVEDSSLKSIFNNVFLYLRDPVVVFSLEAVEEYSELSDAFFFFFDKFLAFLTYKIFFIILAPFALDLYS